MKSKFILLFLFIIFLSSSRWAYASYHFSNYHGRNPIHIYKKNTGAPKGISPEVIKSIYNLPTSGGHGTIAIIGAYDDTTIENDLNVFSKAFNLPACTVKKGCFEKHLVSSGTKTTSGWCRL